MLYFANFSENDRVVLFTSAKNRPLVSQSCEMRSRHACELRRMSTNRIASSFNVRGMHFAG
jgi:hypothetical protein